MKIRPRVPAARLFSSAARHGANYYRPLRDGGQTIVRRLQAISQGQPEPTQPPDSLRISRAAGWYYLATAAGIVGLAVAGAARGDAWCLSLLPIAAVPALLAWGGLRQRKR